MILIESSNKRRQTKQIENVAVSVSLNLNKFRKARNLSKSEKIQILLEPPNLNKLNIN
jgi:hypothetical protein